MAEWYVSGRKVSVNVRVGRLGRIERISPIAHRFLGCPLWKLRRWMEKQGGPAYSKRISELMREIGYGTVGQLYGCKIVRTGSRPTGV